MTSLTRFNDDHAEQILYCVRAFTPHHEAERAEVVEMQTDCLTVLCGGERLVVPLLRAESPQAAFEVTVREAMRRLGVWPPRRVAHWTVMQSKRLGVHFRRLTLHLDKDDRSDWRPGDSCRFDVTAEALPRPYTLRRVHEKTALIDIYCHEGSAGSHWAQSLQIGDVVTARGERHELFPDFTAGETWLLGDETALPTIAALLERWTAPARVQVFLQLRDAGDRAYLDEVRLPPSTRIHWVNDLLTAVEGQANPPAAVWAAGEVGQVMRLRQSLKTQYPTADIRAIGYWKR